jgi:hypothetical protein
MFRSHVFTAARGLGTDIDDRPSRFVVVSSSFRVRTDVRICSDYGRLPNAPQWLCRNRVLRDRE